MLQLDLNFSNSYLPLCSDEPNFFNIDPGRRGLYDEEQSIPIDFLEYIYKKLEQNSCIEGISNSLNPQQEKVPPCL